MEIEVEVQGPLTPHVTYHFGQEQQIFIHASEGRWKRWDHVVFCLHARPQRDLFTISNWTPSWHPPTSSSMVSSTYFFSSCDRLGLLSTMPVILRTLFYSRTRRRQCHVSTFVLQCVVVFAFFVSILQSTKAKPFEHRMLRCGKTGDVWITLFVGHPWTTDDPND